jgi:hypothetical protein
MPGWGTGSFENEDAQSFLRVLQSKVPEDIQQILVRIADHPDYLDASESSIAVAAAEVVATAKGNPPETTPPEIGEWVGKVEGAPGAEMSEVALRAVSRVRTDSELKDLWLEAEGLNEWSAVLRDLEKRLAG